LWSSRHDGGNHDGKRCCVRSGAKSAEIAALVAQRDQIAADAEAYRLRGQLEMAGAAAAIVVVIDHVLAPALEGTPAPGQLRLVASGEEA
jgi:hypothetical protein